MDPEEATPQFSLKLSAPGKIILFGEYSVVFNKPAVASALCLRTNLSLKESSSSSGFIHLKFSAINLDERFSLVDIKNFFHQIEPKGNWNDYLQSLRKFSNNLCKKPLKELDLSDNWINSLVAFLHSFRKCFCFTTGFHISIDSDLAIGSGVGSSASFSVVLAAAAFFYERHLNEKKNSKIEKYETNHAAIEETCKNVISEMAYSCEKIFHGSPSGVDNNTVLRGSMLEFVKFSDGNFRMQSIVTHTINVLLVNTNVQRSTKTLVENVRKLLKNHSEIIECVLNAMENVARKAVTVLKVLKSNLDKTDEMEMYLGELITLNQNLLRVLGVSHPTLENIVSIANKYKLNAKLTGAGGGGFAFIYLPSWVDQLSITNLKKELSTAGFTTSEVQLGGPGLTIEELTYR